MKLFSKSTDTGKVVMYMGDHENVPCNWYYPDSPGTVPDPVLGSQYNGSVGFYSNEYGFCTVDWGDGTIEQIPFTKVKGQDAYRIIFRSLDIEWYKNPDSSTWWFLKEDGTQYVPVPPHKYKTSGNKVVTFNFTNKITWMESRAVMLEEFPVLDLPDLETITIITSDKGLANIDNSKISRSVNLKTIDMSGSSEARLTSIPEVWGKLTKLTKLNLDNSANFMDTEASNIRKIPEYFPNIKTLSLNADYIMTYPSEWKNLSKIETLYVRSARGTTGYDPDINMALDEIDTINGSLLNFKIQGSWYNYEEQKTYRPDLLGKGMGKIKAVDVFENWGITTEMPEYMYEMRAMTSFNVNRAYRTQERFDEFVDNFYDFVTGWGQVTMSGTAADGQRNQFYGLSVICYSADYPDHAYRPSGAIEAPEGFVKGQSNGTPTTQGQKVYVLINNYSQSWTLIPETVLALISAAGVTVDEPDPTEADVRVSLLRSRASGGRALSQAAESLTRERKRRELRQSLARVTGKPYAIMVREGYLPMVVPNAVEIVPDDVTLIPFSDEMEGVYMCENQLNIDPAIVADYFNDRRMDYGDDIV